MIVCFYEQRQRILTDQRHWSTACDRLLLPLKLNPEPVAMVQNGSCFHHDGFVSSSKEMESCCVIFVKMAHNLVADLKSRRAAGTMQIHFHEMFVAVFDEVGSPLNLHVIEVRYDVLLLAAVPVHRTSLV